MVLPPLPACRGTSLSWVPRGDTLSRMGEGIGVTHPPVDVRLQVIA